MNLTESQAGSDVGALRTQAVPLGDGTYAITGEKIYISWADNDFTENTCHLVLARLPDGGAGTKGISLFMVPKFLPDAAGRSREVFAATPPQSRRACRSRGRRPPGHRSRPCSPGCHQPCRDPR
jgi:alkylation response protein AidB-like acyl-CoA dehydrogenase